MTTTSVRMRSSPPALRRASPLLAAGLVISLLLLVVAALLSLRFGSVSLTTREVWRALVDYDPGSYDQTVVRSLRVPRTVIALAVGAGLAVAGAVMQAVTRNPLAGPSILGVSSGASFAVVCAIYLGGLASPAQYVWFSFVGAVGASALVFVIGAAGRGGATPVKLALAGVVVSALLGAWVSAILLLDERTLDVARFWLIGSVAGRPMPIFWLTAPFLLIGVGVCLAISHQLNVLGLGEDTARALGMHTARVRIICSAAVVLIVGAAVSAAGPIGFVGLAVPHMVRAITGPDHRWLLPYSLVWGALLLTVADIAGRLVLRPAELQVGIVTALVGAPVLIYLARTQRVAG